MRIEKVYGFLVSISLFSSTLAGCLWSVNCPCGISNTSFSFCLGAAFRLGDDCSRWANCATCRSDSNECLSCAAGRFGDTCDQIVGLGDDASTSVFPQNRHQKATSLSNSINSKRVRKRSSAYMLSCPDPEPVPLATATRGYTEKHSFFPGEKLGYVCRPGYALVGEPVLRCLDDSRWSAEVPECHYHYTVENDTGTENSCSELWEVANADVIKRPQAAMFTCHSGYMRLGAPVLRCVAPGRWDGALPRCVRPRRRPVAVEATAGAATLQLSDCLDPGQVDNADRYTDGFPENTFFYTITYACASGYTIVGASVIKCLGNDSWSSDKPKCERVVLQSKASENNSTTSDETDSEADEYEDSDDENDSEEDGNDSEEDEGEDSEDGVVTYCQSPGPIENGQWIVLAASNGQDQTPNVEDEEFPERTRLKFYCDYGFSLEGFPTIHCQHRGFWSSEKPTCNPEEEVSACGFSNLHSLRRLFRGVRTLPGEWPWMVAISKISGIFSTLSCGGSLLDSRTVLTAAHCLMDPDLEDTADVRLYFGKYNRSDARDDAQVVTRTPSFFMIHPRYDAVTKDNDIALIRVDPPVPYTSRIRPVCLPTKETSSQNLKPDTSGYVVGWGTTEKNLESEELLMAIMPVLPAPECRMAFQMQNISMLITRNMFCAGFPEGHVASCTGDSGSPFFFHDPQTDRHTVEGIVSFGRQRECGEPHRYTVFTKVSRYLRWINESMAASGQGEVTLYCQVPAPLDYGEGFVMLRGRRTDSLNTAKEEYPPGTILVFSCHDGFEMVGSPSLRCLSSGLWSGAVPVCRAGCGFSTQQVMAVPIWDPYPCEPPWLVGLKIVYNSREDPTLYCAGSLLDDTTVLTSANCLLHNDVLAKTITLKFGNFSSTSTPTRIIPHHQFNATTMENDIGLIRFSPPIKFSRNIRPIYLPTKLTSERNLNQGKKGFAIGLLQADKWKYVLLTILQAVPTSECDATLAKGNVSKRIVGDTMFCARNQDISSKPLVIIGGPFVFYDAMTDRSTLEGVNIQHNDDSLQATVLYTKVSMFLNWIKRQMGTQPRDP